jgi:hypothetical protein
MQDNELTVRNIYLTEMLRQAGLDAEGRDVAERIQRAQFPQIGCRSIL